MRRLSWTLPAWALLGSLAAGCGASHSHVTWTEEPPRREPLVAAEPPAEPPPPPGPVASADPKDFAARNPNPALCETAARRLQPESRDEAWAALKACIEYTPASTPLTITRASKTPPLWFTMRGSRVSHVHETLYSPSITGTVRFGLSRSSRSTAALT